MAVCPDDDHAGPEGFFFSNDLMEYPFSVFKKVDWVVFGENGNIALKFSIPYGRGRERMI